MVSVQQLESALQSYLQSQGIKVWLEEEATSLATRVDVMRERDGDRWYCFSVVHFPDGQLGVWTVELMEYYNVWTDVPRAKISASTLPSWIEELFHTHSSALDRVSV